MTKNPTSEGSASTSNDTIPSDATTAVQHPKVWIDPISLPTSGDVAGIAGNASSLIKQLTLNTFAAYGVGDEESFGHVVGKAVKFTEITVDVDEGNTTKAKAMTVAEVVVDKKMANGANMMHGGCIAYLIDNCCSTPLVALGLSVKRNGVGVTQALNIIYHSPAAIGTCLRITSTSMALGGRSMTSRCEIHEKATGRLVASAFLNKMQPSKL
ncbi:hypothetical protein BD410DRAFT_790638 [Rickenella mellea]|uniref:Thioesterase domain-containing protein n=1 Tax=Rickenella mellea TaxID=50990 RepID=A0A4Y7Q066_9AGAM|nr:hypothetical protein BD410DRAFT_790638 [Rickenella mellea]